MSATNDTPLRVAVLVGSTRDGRFAPVVADWLTGHLAQRADMTAELIDLAVTPLPAVMTDYSRPLDDEAARLLAAVTPKLAAADAFVMVTPEYNHSFPASLKNAIDWHNQQWHAKPVGFVSYGGQAGGLHAVEQLRLVMAELHAITIRNTVSFPGHGNFGGGFSTARRVTDPGADGAVKSMLDQLAWFAHALRDAKAVRPYAV